jgi:DNA-binding winged helix-turn-helix (wHTH) protein
MSILNLPFSSFAKRLIEHLTNGRCFAITGMSNSGKSTLMRALSSPEAEKAVQDQCGRESFIICIDCNRAVSNTPQAFHEVVLRTIMERLADILPGDVIAALRAYYESVTEADTAFAASLSFNLALTDLSEQLEGDLCLLFDAFDEMYISLDERTLRNLRALRDRYGDHLVFATATSRTMLELRGKPYNDEFAELFASSTYSMPLLDEQEAQQLLESLQMPTLTKEKAALSFQLANGHPGLLIAVAQVLAKTDVDRVDDMARLISREPLPRSECLKLWNQLNDAEQESLLALAAGGEDAELPRQVLRHLEQRSLVKDGKPFSLIFTDFLMRKVRGPEIERRGVYIDADSGEVWVDGARIPLLTDLEFRLLALLYERRGKLTDKYRIVITVWGEEYLGEVDDARVEKLISRLRSKIEPEPVEPRYIITQRGRGYKLISVPREL